MGRLLISKWVEEVALIPNQNFSHPAFWIMIYRKIPIWDAIDKAIAIGMARWLTSGLYFQALSILQW